MVFQLYQDKSVTVLEWRVPIWVKRVDAGKLDPHAAEGQFVGYNEEAKGYRIYWAKKRSISVERNVYVDKDAVMEPGDAMFEGEDLPGSNPHIPTSQPLPKQEEPDIPPKPIEMPTENPLPTENPMLKSNKAHRDLLTGLPQFDQASYGHGKHQSAKEATLIESMLAVNAESLEPGGAEFELPITGLDWFREAVLDALSAITEDQPHIDQAIKGPESDQWKEAIESELTQIEKLDTWDVVEAPPDANIIDSRFVLRRKRDAEGNVSRFKARLVAKGFKQRFGVDYTETFAPTVRPETLRVLLSLAALLGAVIEQADVKNAYLHSLLHDGEEIYMYRPRHFDTFRSLPAKFANRPTRTIVLRLRRPLYGTKQGAHHWYEELRRILLLLEFRVLAADEAVFYKVKGAEYVIIAAATDDFTFIADSIESAALVKKQMNEHFELVDLGPINWILGVSVVRDTENRTITLGQEAYVNQILSRFGLENARPAVTPMEPGADFTPDSPSVSPTLLTAAEKTTYREMIGSLMYLAVMMHPDISFAITSLSQYLDVP